MAINLRRRTRGRVCPFCRGELGQGEAEVRCLACDTTFHLDCRDEVRNCTTIGCVGAWSDRPESRRRSPRADRADRQPTAQEEFAQGWAGQPTDRFERVYKGIAAAFAVGVFVLSAWVLNDGFGVRTPPPLPESSKVQMLALRFAANDAEVQQRAQTELEALGPEQLRKLIYAFANAGPRGARRAQAIALIRAKVRDRATLRRLIDQLNTSNQAARQVAYDVLDGRLPLRFELAETRALLQSLEYEPDALVKLLRRHEVPVETVERALVDVPIARSAVREYVRERRAR